MTATEFKHSNDTLDIRDSHLVSFNKETGILVTEASELKGAGIEVQLGTYYGNYCYYIWIWSEKYNGHFQFNEVKSEQVKNGEGEIIADVFRPVSFTEAGGVLSIVEQTYILKEVNNYRLHILND